MWLSRKRKIVKGKKDNNDTIHDLLLTYGPSKAHCYPFREFMWQILRQMYKDKCMLIETYQYSLGSLSQETQTSGEEGKFCSFYRGLLLEIWIIYWNCRQENAFQYKHRAMQGIGNIMRWLIKHIGGRISDFVSMSLWLSICPSICHLPVFIYPSPKCIVITDFPSEGEGREGTGK